MERARCRQYCDDGLLTSKHDPGLLLAAYETITNVLSMGIARLLHHGLFDEAAKDEFIRAAAIEELLLHESVISGMRGK
jgi:cytochrome P450